MKITWWIPAAMALLVSCSSGSSKKEIFVSPHINLEQVGDSQSVYLTKINPSITKEIIANGKREEKNLPIQDWNKELDIITKFNLDKPAFVGNYAIDTILNGSILQKTFVSRKSDLSIKFQRIELDSLGNIIHIESLSEDKNFLYYTKKELVADFKVIEGKSRLKEYATKATQKIIGLDTFNLEVNVKIE